MTEVQQGRPWAGPGEAQPSSRGVNVRIAAVGSGALAAALTQTLLLPVLPEIQRDLGASTSGAQWLLTSTLLVAAVSVPIVGRLADMYGRRRLLLACLGTLTLGSLIDALTSNLGLMIFGRALAGVSAAAIPLGISLLAAQLPRERAGSAVALISAMLGIGSALGLPLAGVIAQNADYHVLFWIIAAAAALSTAALALLVRESPHGAVDRVDWLGILLLCAGLVALLLPLAQAGEWGWGSARVLGLFAVSVVCVSALFRVERRTPDPLIDLAAVARRPILMTNVASVFIGFALFASFVGTASYVQAPQATGYGFGSSVIVSGLCLLPTGLLMLLLAPVSARLSARWGAHRVLSLAAVIATVGLLERIVLIDHLWEIIIGTSIVGAGTGIGYAAMPTLINTNSPPDELAAANGINSLARALGSTLASAIGGTLLAALTVTLGAAELPSLTAYRILFSICAAAALSAALVASLIPQREPRTTPTSQGVA